MGDCRTSNKLRELSPGNRPKSTQVRKRKLRNIIRHPFCGPRIPRALSTKVQGPPRVKPDPENLELDALFGHTPGSGNSVRTAPLREIVGAIHSVVMKTLDARHRVMVDGEQAAQLNMAQTVKPRDVLGAIPQFDGNSGTCILETFLEGCHDAKVMIDNADEGTFMKYIRLKIGKRSFLKRIFSPGKTACELLGDIAHQYQKRDETVLTRIRRLGSRILEAPRIETGAEPTDVFKADLNRIIVRTFKRGLLRDIKRATTDKTDVQALVQLATSAEREVEAVS